MNTGNNTGPASSFPDHEVTGPLKRRMSSPTRIHHIIRKQTAAWRLFIPYRPCSKGKAPSLINQRRCKHNQVAWLGAENQGGSTTNGSVRLLFSSNRVVFICFFYCHHLREIKDIINFFYIFSSDINIPMAVHQEKVPSVLFAAYCPGSDSQEQPEHVELLTQLPLSPPTPRPHPSLISSGSDLQSGGRAWGPNGVKGGQLVATQGLMGYQQRPEEP